MPRRHLIDLHEAGARLNVSPWTIRRKIASGELKGFRIGPRSLRVDEAEVSALVERSVMPNGRNMAAQRHPRPRSGPAEGTAKARNAKDL